MALRIRKKAKDTYLDLVIAFPLLVVKNEDELKASIKVMDKLVGKGDLDDGEEAYLDALSNLIADYENKEYHIGPVSDADMLRFLMEQKGVTQAELAKGSKVSKSTVSEILAGKPFTTGNIRKLAAYFNVDKGVLVANL